MDKKRVVPIWVSVILLVLCAINIGAVILMLSDIGGTLSLINCVLCICAIALALVYCFMGYKKSAAKLFTIFSAVLLLLVLLQINHYATTSKNNGPGSAPMEQYNVETNIDANVLAQGPQDVENEETSFEDSKAVLITVPTILFGMLFTLTVAKNLGKKKSYWLAGLSFALSLFSFILALIHVVKLYNNFSSGLGIINAGVSIEFTIFILCAIYGVMVYAKYQDKQARGTN